MDKFFPLKRDYDYAFIGLLMTEDKPTGPGGSHSMEELYSLAKRIYEKAVGQYGFKPGEILLRFDGFPAGDRYADGAGGAGIYVPGIRDDQEDKERPGDEGRALLAGHQQFGSRFAGRRIGVCRAYVAKAMEYGLDAGIVNVAHHYGRVPADPDLVALVDAFAKMDGSAEATNNAMMLDGQVLPGESKGKCLMGVYHD